MSLDYMANRLGNIKMDQISILKVKFYGISINFLPQLLENYLQGVEMGYIC